MSPRVAGGLRPTSPPKNQPCGLFHFNLPCAFSLFSFLFSLFSYPGNHGNFLAMSAETLTQLFLGETQNPWLDEILRQQVAKVKASEPGLTPSGCLLTDMGDFLLRATNILSRLANDIVYGQHIHIYTKKKLREMKEDHDLSDLSPLEDMDEKHTSLQFATVDRPLSCAVLTSRLDLLPRV
jgi:hypothetical protein